MWRRNQLRAKWESGCNGPISHRATLSRHNVLQVSSSGIAQSRDEVPLDDATAVTLLARVRYVVDAEVAPPRPQVTSADPRDMRLAVDGMRTRTIPNDRAPWIADFLTEATSAPSPTAAEPQVALDMWGGGCEAAGHLSAEIREADGRLVLEVAFHSVGEQPKATRLEVARPSLEQFVAEVVAIKARAAIGPAVGRTGIGNFELESRLDGSLYSYVESDDTGKLRQLGDRVLGFLRSQGVELGDDLHPLSDL